MRDARVRRPASAVDVPAREPLGDPVQQPVASVIGALARLGTAVGSVAALLVDAGGLEDLLPLRRERPIGLLRRP
jgi:hypothetical protein